jgi:hypothetical protein
MIHLHRIVGALLGRVESNAKRRPRPGRAGFGPLAEMLETRTLLSQVSLGAASIVHHPGEGVPAVISSTQLPSFRVTYQANQTSVLGSVPQRDVVHPTTSVPLDGAADLASTVPADDETSGVVAINGQIEVQLDDEADADSSGIVAINGQIEVQR